MTRPRGGKRWRDRTLRVRPMLLLACLVPFGAAACFRADDAARIRELIREGAALAEKHRVDEMLALTTKDLRVDPGGHDRAAVKEILALALLHYGRFRILYPEPGIELSEDHNAAHGYVHFLVAAPDSLPPELEKLRLDPASWLQAVGEHPDLYRLELALVKTKKDWRVTAAYLDSRRQPGFLRQVR